MHKTLIAAAAGLVAAAGSASAFTFSPFNGATISDNGWLSFQLDDSMVPAGAYTGYTVTLDWVSDIQGNSFSDTWSNEADLAFANEAGSGTGFQPTYSGAEIVYSGNTAPTSGSEGSSFNTSLTWTGAFNSMYTGGDLFFNYRQSFDGSNVVNWNNVSVTLNTLSTPAATDLGVLGAGNTTVTETLSAGEIKWFRFEITEDIDAGSFLDIHTGLSVLAPSEDTELGLYSESGALLGTDDDGFGDTLHAMLTYGDGGGTLVGDPSGTSDVGDGRDGVLPAGVYYLAAGGFNTTFGEFFGATTTSITEGDLVVSFTTIPTPGSAAVLALGGLVATRRRR